MGNLSAETIDGLLFMVGPLYFGFYLLAMFLMSFCKLDKKRHAEILAELEKRRDAASL